MTKSANRYLYFMPALVWWAFSFYLFMLPGSAFPKAGWLSQFHIDKLVHIFLFAMLVYLFFWGIQKASAQKPIPNSVQLTVIIIAVTYGVVVEFLQEKYIVNRAFDFYDMLADAAGALLPGLWLMLKSRQQLNH